MNRLALYTPIRELFASTDKLFDRLFGKDFLSVFRDLDKEFSRLAEDIKLDDKKDKIIVTVNTDGVEKKDLKINYEDGVLIVQGETKKEVETGKGKDKRKEYYYNRLYKSIALPEEVDIKKASAKYSGGKLTITLPREKVKKSPEEIVIK